MASRTGFRPKGTDGSDFSHRERVAEHIKISAQTKPKLKRVVRLQIPLLVLCLTVGLLVKYDYPSLLCFSGYLAAIPLGFFALDKNSSTYMNMYGVCCSMLGVFPMTYLLYLSLWTGMVSEYRYLRIAEALMVVSVNVCGMFFAKQLLVAWSVGTSTKRR